MELPQKYAQLVGERPHRLLFEINTDSRGGGGGGRRALNVVFKVASLDVHLIVGGIGVKAAGVAGVYAELVGGAVIVADSLAVIDVVAK